MKKSVFFSENEDKFLEILGQDLKNRIKGRVAIKLHMGEKGNKFFLKPTFVKKIINILLSIGVKPFLFDSPVVYNSSRNTVKGYQMVAKEHGFSEENIGCPVVISDEFIEETISLEGKEVTYQVCKSLSEADGVLVLSHVKGHICSGFGAGIKNLGMGALTKASKGLIHDGGEPVYTQGCSLCGLCSKNCPTNNIRYENRPFFDKSWCCGCSNCIAVCPIHALKPKIALFSDLLSGGAWAALKNFKKAYFINVLKDIAKLCDCDPHAGPKVLEDIGYLCSEDLTAIDKASHDFIIKRAGKDIFKELHHISPLNHIKAFARFSGTSLEYSLKSKN